MTFGFPGVCQFRASVHESLKGLIVSFPKSTVNVGKSPRRCLWGEGWGMIDRLHFCPVPGSFLRGIGLPLIQGLWIRGLSSASDSTWVLVSRSGVHGLHWAPHWVRSLLLKSEAGGPLA